MQKGYDKDNNEDSSAERKLKEKIARLQRIRPGLERSLHEKTLHIDNLEKKLTMCREQSEEYRNPKENRRKRLFGND